mmetsp:Transcript_80627/g.207564  ORF Transcript_80627/g.207564 Transcript_80627/m.207564 type:complete len:338 (-) Transcript_80627:239-1252(-)
MRLLALDEGLLGIALALQDDEELVAMVALLDDLRVGRFEGLHLQSVRNGHHLVAIHVGEERHLLQEFCVLAALLGSGVLHDPIEGLTVELPEHQLGLGHNAGRSGCVVEQRELSEDIAVAARLHALVLAVDLLEAVHGALLDEEHALTVVALLDESHALVDGLLLEGEDHGVHLLLVQRLEKEDLLNGFFDAALLLHRLLVHRGGEGCLDVPLAVSLRRDALARAAVELRRLWHDIRYVVLLVLLLVLIFVLISLRGPVGLDVGLAISLRPAVLGPARAAQRQQLRLALRQLLELLPNRFDLPRGGAASLRLVGAVQALGLLAEPLEHEERGVLWSL